MNIYPLNSTQEDMLRESNMETMENLSEILRHQSLCPCPSGQTRGRTVYD